MHKIYKTVFNNYILAFIFFSVIGINLWMYFGVGGIHAIKFISGGRGLPDFFLYQSIDKLNALMLDYGSEGKLFYLRYQFRDFIYPLFYGALLMGVLYRLIKPRGFNVWMYVPLIAAFFDFSENYFLRLCFYDFPNLVESHVMYASISTSLKWFFVLFSFVLIVIAYINRRKKYLAKSKLNNQRPNIYNS